MSEPVRLGLIGCGFAAREIHAPRLRELPERFTVRATCDLDEGNARRLAAQLGAERVYTNPKDLFAAGDLDAVAVLTPVHEPHVSSALDHGLDTFVEKPLAERPETAFRLAEQAGAAERVLMVGTMRAYDQAVAQARSALKDIGPLLWVEIRDACSASTSAPTPTELTEPVLQAALPAHPDPRYRNALQAALLEMIHDVSVLRALVGGPIACDDAWVAWDGWTLCGRLSLPGGVPCQFGVAEYGRIHADVFDLALTAIGEHGVLRLGFADANRPALPTLLEVSGRPAGRLVTDTYMEEWRQFHRLIAAGGAGGDPHSAAEDVQLLYDIVERALA